MSSPRILVVDDNPTNLKLVVDLLEYEGYDIVKAIDAEEALTIIRSMRLDLVLLDIALPGMDGMALTRILKADEATRDLIVVALTAFAMKGDEAKIMDAGFDGYVTKPIDIRSLLALVAQYLKSAESH